MRLAVTRANDFQGRSKRTVIDVNVRIFIKPERETIFEAYAKDKNSITIQVTHTTRAMCPPDSLDQTFIKNVNAASVYFFSEGSLYLDLKYDTDTMKFDR